MAITSYELAQVLTVEQAVSRGGKEGEKKNQEEEQSVFQYCIIPLSGKTRRKNKTLTSLSVYVCVHVGVCTHVC